MIVLHEALSAPPCNTPPPLSMHARGKLRYDVSIDANAQRAMASNTTTQHKLPSPVLDIDHLSVQGPGTTLEAMTLDNRLQCICSRSGCSSEFEHCTEIVTVLFV